MTVSQRDAYVNDPKHSDGGAMRNYIALLPEPDQSVFRHLLRKLVFGELPERVQERQAPLMKRMLHSSR